jgi:hypothetical protein
MKEGMCKNYSLGFFHDTTQQRKDSYLIYNIRDDEESAEA